MENYKYWYKGVKYTANNQEEANAHCEQLIREENAGNVQVSAEEFDKLLAEVKALKSAKKKTSTKNEGK